MEFASSRPGHRGRICLYDWNRDGKLDILIGDLVYAITPLDLTPEQQQRKQDLETLREELFHKAELYNQEINQRIYEQMGHDPDKPMTTEQKSLFISERAKMMRAPEFIALSEKIQEVHADLETLTPRGKSYGFVWVYLRK